MDPLPLSRRRSPQAVSVAELLCRYDTAPVVPLPRTETVPAEPVPVSALLRREGRARRALDRPLVPRGHSRPAPAAAEPPRHGARKATAAAGALFVVGAVFGAGVLEEALLRPDAGADPADGFAADGSTGIGSGADGVRGTGPGVTLAATEALLLPGFDLPAVTGADIGAAGLAPRSSTPGSPTPGSLTPGSLSPGSPTPGSLSPGSPTPGSPTPGSLTPGSPLPPGVPGAGPGAPVAPGAGPAPDGSGPVAPTPVDPGAVDPGTSDPETGPVEVPDLGTPEVEIPAVVLPPTPLGPVGTPSITVTEAAAVTPDVGVSVDGDGLGVGTTDTALVTPDAELGALDAGPVGLTGADATLGDVAVEGTELLRVGAEPEVTLPAVTITPTELETPDLRVGDAVVEVPDLALPEISTAEVPVVETVGGLLGVGSGDGDPDGGDSGDGDSGDGDSGDGDSASDGGSAGGGSPLALVEAVPLLG